MLHYAEMLLYRKSAFKGSVPVQGDRRSRLHHSRILAKPENDARRGLGGWLQPQNSCLEPQMHTLSSSWTCASSPTQQPVAASNSKPEGVLLRQATQADMPFIRKAILREW
eukprot:1161841-Pelagomonas_calceolata.AAC.14